MSRRIVHRLAAVGVAGLALLGLAAWAVWPAPTVPPSWMHEYDVNARPFEFIPPGTAIDRSAPPGWTHLVIKGMPRIRPSERTKVNDFTARFATWMFTAFIADVRPEKDTSPPQHRIINIAHGLGCNINGRDIIITPETAKQHGAEIGWVKHTILSKGYERQKQSVVVFNGPSAWLVDSTLWFHLKGKNRLVRYRFLLLADGPGGPLDVTCWLIDPDGKLADPAAVVWLNQNAIDEAELVIDSSEFSLGLPSEAAFGVDKLPPGRIAGIMNADLVPLATRSQFSTDDARTLETGIRRMLADAGRAP